ncbi:Wzz/FepE/Etk N-terminal domain-containing protein, partial [Ohessyouella blattaphilus]
MREEYTVVNEDEVEIDLLEIARVLLNKIWMIILCVIVGVTLAFGVTKFVITPQYTATSMIYILSNTTSISSAVDLQLSKQLTIDFEILAKSRPVIERVI